MHNRVELTKDYVEGRGGETGAWRGRIPPEAPAPRSDGDRVRSAGKERRRVRRATGTKVGRAHSAAVPPGAVAAGGHVPSECYPAAVEVARVIT